ncbi:MAG: TIM barrel protein [Nitrospiraceae bacterium]|nr:TIM barrel protein [Nitrospiraceae bacterium]
MKYAFMTFSTPGLSLSETLDVAKRYGYDGIEPRMDAGHAHGVEIAATKDERAGMRAQAEEAGIALACLATSLTYADPAKTGDMLRQTHERIDLAGDLGIPAMRVFGGGIPEGISREQATDLLVSSLESVADHAAERSVVLCFETHDDWCDPNYVAAVLERVNHPHVAANWDIMHPVMRGHSTMDEAFETLRSWIRHLHIHDGTAGGGLVTIGEGIIDHRRALELLATTAFDGHISGEWINWEPYEDHLPRELAILKEWDADFRGFHGCTPISRF